MITQKNTNLRLRHFSNTDLLCGAQKTLVVAKKENSSKQFRYLSPEAGDHQDYPTVVISFLFEDMETSE